MWFNLHKPDTIRLRRSWQTHNATSNEEGLNRNRGRRKCPPLCGCCLVVRPGYRRSCVSVSMEKVSGHFGLKYGGIDKFGNHNKAEVCRTNTALLLLLSSRVSFCRCCSAFKSFRICSKWAKLKQTIRHRERAATVWGTFNLESY